MSSTATASTTEWLWRGMLLLLFGFGYVLCATLGQWLVLAPGHNATLWPPSGVFVAVLLNAERRYWWQYLLVGLVADIFAELVVYEFTVPVGLIVSFGNTAEAFCGAWLVRRFCGTPFRFFGVRDV